MVSCGSESQKIYKMMIPKMSTRTKTLTERMRFKTTKRLTSIAGILSQMVRDISQRGWEVYIRGTDFSSNTRRGLVNCRNEGTDKGIHLSSKVYVDERKSTEGDDDILTITLSVNAIWGITTRRKVFTAMTMTEASMAAALFVLAKVAPLRL